MWSTLTGLLVVVGVAVGVSVSRQSGAEDVSEEAAVRFLQKVDQDSSAMTQKSVEASWNYESNITEYNLKRQVISILYFTCLYPSTSTIFTVV